MADFVAVLKKTLEGLSDTTPAMREKVYEKARITISGKLAAMNPPLPEGVVAKQKQALEEAIVQVEKEYARSKPADPLSELESVFASLKNPAPHIPLRDPAAKAPAAEKAPPPVPAAKPPVLTPAAAPAAKTPPPAHAKADPAPKAAVPVVLPVPANNPKPVAEFEDDNFSQQDAEPPFLPEKEDGETIAPEEEPERRRGYGLVVALVVLALLAGGGYLAWLKRDQVEQLLARVGITGLNLSSNEPAAAPTAPAAETPAPDVAAVQPSTAPEPVQPAPEAAAPAPVDAGPQKFTQRLSPDGTEIDAGPAGGPAAIGEGTSVAAVTQPSMPAAEPVEPPATAPQPATPTETPAATAETPETPPAAPDAAVAPDAAAAPATPAETPTPPATPDAAATPDTAAAPATPSETPTPPADPAQAGTTPAAAEPVPPVQPAQPAQQEQSVAVGQKAIFYEERTNVSEASAEPGSIVWSLVQESPGGDLPPEPAIRAEATIPGKDVQLRMTIRRNADQTLPASHIVEMIFLTPQGFEGGGIENVLRLSLKGSEQEAGSPLLGIPAKIADGFFLIALNDSKPEIEANTRLLRSQSWIDVPVQYKSGRRALFTMEKGIPGTKVFDEALKAWQAAGSG
ncbi:hypothetical protein [Mesorhizobium sp. IMUNJ 23232]|uniref:hypothetical protein n=1 Tax=Mesorhizobium sp. IMUNJ 23232 TaxID=3376064 RepID=UPI0037932AD5